MATALSFVLDLALFVVTVGWLGRRPTLPKTSAMIAVVAAVNIARDSAAAATQGLNIYGLYLQSLNTVADSYAGVIDATQAAAMQPYFGLIAGCWFGIYVIQAAWLVFVALGLVWIVKRLFKRKLEWAPLSSIDLPIWMVGALIVGILLVAVSNIAGVPHMVRLVGCNVLLIAAIPVCVQGVAAYKGVMNRVKFPTVAQVVVTLVLLFFGLFLPVVLVIGVVDFWANIRRLPREDSDDEARTYM